MNSCNALETLLFGRSLNRSVCERVEEDYKDLNHARSECLRNWIDQSD